MIYVFHLHLKPNDGHRKILDLECDTQLKLKLRLFQPEDSSEQKPVKQPCTNNIVNLCYIVCSTSTISSKCSSSLLSSLGVTL